MYARTHARRQARALYRCLVYIGTRGSMHSSCHCFRTQPPSLDLVVTAEVGLLACLSGTYDADHRHYCTVVPYETSRDGFKGRIMLKAAYSRDTKQTDTSKTAVCLSSLTHTKLEIEKIQYRIYAQQASKPGQQPTAAAYYSIAHYQTHGKRSNDRKKLTHDRRAGCEGGRNKEPPPCMRSARTPPLLPFFAFASTINASPPPSLAENSRWTTLHDYYF